MPAIADRNHCSGCGVCAAVCSRNVIAMVADEEGLIFPRIGRDQCVSCGKCVKVCPVLSSGSKREPMAVYAAYAQDVGLRHASSSGGLFSLLARQIFEASGIVYGVAFREEDGAFVHQSAETEEELALLRGSKYVQSQMGDVYQRVLQDLKKGRQVIFTGTPCQIAGMRHYLGREYSNLVCVEVICHAVPSPLAWKAFLRARETRAGGNACRVLFRNKSTGWENYSLVIKFKSGQEYQGVSGKDLFLRGFLAELYNRRSCASCSFRELRSGADLTLGDYWNVREKIPQMDDGNGTSVILINTEKGQGLFEKIRSGCVVAVSDYADIQRTNPALVRSSAAHKNREKFFRLIRKGCDFDTVVGTLLRRPVWRRMASSLKRYCIKVVRG